MKIFNKPKDFRNLALGITLDLVKEKTSWGPSDVLEHAMLIEAYLSGRLRYNFLKNPGENSHSEAFITDLRPAITEGLVTPKVLPVKPFWFVVLSKLYAFCLSFSQYFMPGILMGVALGLGAGLMVFLFSCLAFSVWGFHYPLILPYIFMTAMIGMINVLFAWVDLWGQWQCTIRVFKRLLSIILMMGISIGCGWGLLWLVL